MSSGKQFQSPPSSAFCSFRRSLLTLAVLSLISFICFSLKSLKSPLQNPSPTTLVSAKVETENVAEEEKKDEISGVFHSPEVFRLNYGEMERKFKVYIYPDGDPNTFYQTPRKLTGKYAGEGYFFQNIRESRFRTEDPDQADLFFIPISCHKMRGKRKEGMVFKLDFEKAYDHVNWTFLDFVLRMKGFGDKWRLWVNGCFRYANLSILINGKPRGRFGATRGLKIKMNKSIVAGINIEVQVVRDIAAIVGCGIGEWLLNYLGLPLGGNPLSKEFWTPVLDKGTSYENMTLIVQSYVEGLISKYPYWNRTLGADHFFVTCHDVGVRATEGLPLLVKNSIRVVCSPSYDVGFIPHKDVALPQVLQPFALPAGGNDVENRTMLGFWAGHRNSKIRVILARVWENDTDLYVLNNRINRATGDLLYQKRFYITKYCICPGGSQVNSARIADSIHYGCIPVILSNYYDLPFNDILDWRKFSIIVKESDVYQLKQILQNIPDEEFLALHRNLIKVQRHFQWNSPPTKYDAFHMDWAWLSLSDLGQAQAQPGPNFTSNWDST
ncbi:putative glycosyltransferase [Morus notabilis]|uniref:Putative glycosyltransferase n=1 Tax=Morus notabilis TaxID=981085 RepID=W9T120_9ROSA|nr:putative glycosyltransferase [Morus notabilis]